jgi:ribosomal protein S18 acetylase RimI-like enzyme
MESAFSFKIIDLPIEFERFFMQYYLLWESDWIRQQKYVGTDYYAIEGNLATWKNYYTTENFILLECFMNNEAIGYLSYKTENERIHMEALLLLPNFRGKGLMAKMLGVFFNYLETENTYWTSIYLETNAHNPANSIYRKFGFTVAEVLEKDRENGEDTYVYQLEHTHT